MKVFGAFLVAHLIGDALAYPAEHSAGVTSRDDTSPAVIFPRKPKAKVPLPPGAAWAKKECTDKGVISANDPSEKRWKALDTNNALIWAGNYHEAHKKSARIPYVEYISDMFHGPEGWDCQKITSKKCNEGVQCDQVSTPAIYFVMNSISTLHEILFNAYSATDTARSDLQFSLGPFMDTFCPKKKPDMALEIFKTIIDTVAFAASMSSAYVFNRLITTGPLLSSDQRGLMKDSANAGIAYILNANKDNLKGPTSEIGNQNKMADQANIYFKQIMHAFSDYTDKIFSGKGNYKQQLFNLLKNGAFMPNNNLNVNVEDLRNEIRTLVYGRMIPQAWRMSPKKAFIPVVLETDEKCGSDKRGMTKKAFTDKTAKSTRVCVDGVWMYLLSAQPFNCRPLGDEMCPQQDFFEPLPGGTHDVLDGKKWGKIKVEDVVRSVHEGYKKKGRNGYKADGKDIGNQKPMDYFSKGVRFPGYWDVPFCPKGNWKDIVLRLSDGSGKRGPFWPCEN